jgi:argininosuccinate synthase
MMKEKVVLAYSGGLDTSVILTWLKNEHNYEVIAVCVDVGQAEDYDALKTKALKTGAKKAIVIDAVQDFVKDYAFVGLKAGAVYEDDYLLGTAFARPLIAKKLVEVALYEGAVAIAHGATGKGNDQVRFEATIKALAPELKIIAPWREWTFKSREDLMGYASKFGIPVPTTQKEPYSRDENIWHLSHEGGDLEDPWNAHDESIYKMTAKIDQTPDEGESIVISFYKGTPVAIDGIGLAPVELLKVLNAIGGKHGIGISDIVENRLVGMKSRGVYETPGGTILYKAHSALEKLTLDKDTLHYKQMMSIKYAELVYNGLWFSPLKQAMDAFVEDTQEFVSGEIKLLLKKGQARILASQSEFSLYSMDFVTFEKDEVYNQKDAEGFINLFTLPLSFTAKRKLAFSDQQNPKLSSVKGGVSY